jgi:leucyl-tRNA synthetase
MSKSIGNVVNPSEVIDSGYGADAMRLIIAFLAPYDQTTPWNPEGVAGTFRFLQRVWTLCQEFLGSSGSGESNDQLMRASHKAVYKVSDDLNDMQFNTAIAALMEFTNELYKIKADRGFSAQKDWKFALTTLLKLLAPFAPHITEELWQYLGEKNSIHTVGWPKSDEKYLIQSKLNVVVQINGKLRANIEVPAASSEQEVIETAKKHEKIKKHLENKKVRKTIYVPGKLVNFVI